MKKIAVFTIFAVSAIFPFSGASLCAGDAGEAGLAARVAELEKAVAASDTAMLEMMDKNMGVINRLRTENRQLRARVAELEAALAKPAETPAKKSVYDSTRSGMEAARDSNRELSMSANAPFDSLKSDNERAYPDKKKESYKAPERKPSETGERKSESSGSGKSDSIWDNMFPF